MHVLSAPRAGAVLECRRQAQLSAPRRAPHAAPARPAARDLRVRAEAQDGATSDSEELLSDAELKAREAERLRAAERFMMVGTGEADCSSCGYVYVPRAGDPEYPVAPGTQFSELPKDWQCPVCGAEKPAFKLRLREVAGFAENQGYGLGANTMTGEQKSLLIFGSLLAFFALFLLGYTMD